VQDLRVQLGGLNGNSGCRDSQGGAPAGATHCAQRTTSLKEDERRCCYWVAMVKLCGKPAAITVGDADVTGEVTCAFPAESM
jgi:hypothetical protein